VCRFCPQDAQQFAGAGERARGGCPFPAADACEPLGGVKLRAGEPHGIRDVVGPEVEADAVTEKRPVHRLGLEIRRATLEGLFDRDGIVQPGQHEDRESRAPRRGAHPAAHLVAIDVRHHHVEQHQVEGFRLQQVDRFQAMLHQGGAIARARKDQGCRAAQEAVVIDHQQVARPLGRAHAEPRGGVWTQCQLKAAWAARCIDPGGALSMRIGC